LFRTGADCDADHRSVSHINSYGDSDRRCDADRNGDADLYGDGDVQTDGDGDNANSDREGNSNWRDSGCSGNLDAGSNRGLSDGCESEWK